jgi:hypothetical protein
MKKQLIPLVVVFAIVALGTLAMNGFLVEKGVNVWVVQGGNLLLFVTSVATFLFYSGAMRSQKGYGFVQKVYAGFTIKFFVLITGALLYFYFSSEPNKPAVFICLGIYLVYNFLGTSQAIKKPKHQPPHAHAPARKHKHHH